MQLVLSSNGSRRDVEVRVERPDAPVAELVAGLDPGSHARKGLLIDGRWFGPDLDLAEVGLYEGAVVHISDRPRQRVAMAAPVAVGLGLCVVGGPDAGAVCPIEPGRPVVVGRAPGCDLSMADPSLSKRHARIEIGGEGVVEVTDLGSSNGTEIDGERIAPNTPARAAIGAKIQMGSSTVRVRHLDATDRPVAVDPLTRAVAGVVPFNRPPRSALASPPAPLAVPDPPGADARSQVPLQLLAILAPLAMAAGMARYTGSLQYAMFGLLSPVMAVASFVSARRRAGKAHRVSSRAFDDGLATLDDELADLQVAEVRRMEDLLPDLAEVRRRALLPSARLWQRRPDHADFLRLRAGMADVAWRPPLDVRHDRRLHPDLARTLERHAWLPRCPVSADLSNGGVVGVIGNRQAALSVARSLIVQGAIHHGPADVSVAVLATSEHADDWTWAGWLPHVRDASGTTRLLAGDHATGEALVAALAAAPPSHTRFFVVDDLDLLEGRRAPLRHLLRGEGGPACGIVLAGTEDQLPAACSIVVDVEARSGFATVRRPGDGSILRHVTVDGLTADAAGDIARALARFEDPEVAVPGAGLPPVVRSLALLGMGEASAAAVLSAWEQGGPDPTPAAPIGVGESGVTWIDLAVDGPHALVGGTTGSGKSELLRSMVAGMAALVDPDHLVFLLLDYKGGSGFDECARLPHVLEVVTDLDEHLGPRALRSLEAELRHRERLLRQAGAADLPSYLRSGAPLGPLPRLVVVIDEFGALSTQLPDFVDALVGIAQRGRSLGVHLVLATQRPQGVVSASIKANTNLRIALRVQDPGDSTDIVDCEAAAWISRATPGRAYLRRGPGEVEVVQTALATSALGPRTAGAVHVGPTVFGPRPMPDLAPTTLDTHDRVSELTMLIEAVRAAAETRSFEPPRPVCLPMLDDTLPLGDVVPAATRGAADPRETAFALADDPDNQCRVAVGWNPGEGHLAVLGMVGSGTTTAALAAVAALAQRRSPDDLHVYGLDLGPGGLAPLVHLPHTGAVLAAGQAEARTRLVRRLKAEVARRRDLAPHGLETEPLVVVVVDGMATLLAELEGVESIEESDDLRRVLADGPAVGVAFVLTADRPGALPPRILSSISQRLLLRLADPGDYALVGLRPKEVPTFVPGRALHVASGLVVQVGHPGDVRAVGDQLRARWATARRPAPPVRTLPVAVSADELPTGRIEDDVLVLPVGMAEADITVAALALHPGEHALVAGPPRSGISTALGAVAQRVKEADRDAVVVAICGERSPLFKLDLLDAAGDLAGLAGYLRVAARHDRRWVLLVEDAPVTDDRDGVLAALVGCRRPGLHVVAGGQVDDVRRQFVHWSRPVRQSRTGLLLNPDLVADGDIFSVRLPRRVPVGLGPGRGFVVNAGRPELAVLAR